MSVTRLRDPLPGLIAPPRALALPPAHAAREACKPLFTQLSGFQPK